MRRIAFLIVLCSLAFALPASNLQTDLRTYSKEHPLIYEDAWDLWPYVFNDDEGNPSGYNVELLKMIFEELDIPYEIHLKPTSKALEDLKTGKSDLMLGMVANFHDEYTLYYGKNVIQLFTHSVAHPKDALQRVHQVEDLASQQVIVHDGSFSHHLMEDRGWGSNAIPYGDMDKAIQLVSADGSGQVLWNTMSLKWLIHKYHADNLMLSPVDMPSGDYRFMANDKLLLELLDNTFSRLKASEKLLPLERKWFYPEEAPNEGWPDWLLYLLGGIGIATVILIVDSLVYRMREQRVTKESRRNNARLALILKNSQMKIWTYDVNKNTFLWYGNNSRNKKALSVHEFSKNYHSKDFEHLMDGINKLMNKEESSIKLEMNIMDVPGGKDRTHVINLSVLRSEKGKPAIIIGTNNDISDIRHKQQQSYEMMHRYQAVFNTAMVDMVAYDRYGYITNMNARAQETFKMKLEDVLRDRVNLRDLLKDGNINIQHFKENDHFFATLFLNYDEDDYIESRKRKGSLYYEFQLMPVFGNDHKLLGAYGTGHEVTEVVKTYQKARSAVEHLRKAQQAVSDHVNNINYALQVGGVRMVYYSPVTHMLSINHRMHEAQYVLTQQRCLDMTSTGSIAQVMRAFRTMDRQADMPINCDVKTNLRLPGGKMLCLEMHLFPVIGNDGKPARYAGICRDTTEMKFTEQMLQLETEKAQEIEQVKNKFLHNMCYEIRTPLNTVVGFAEMFEKEHTVEEENVFIQEIKDNTAYLLKLINDILFLSRLDAKMVEINVMPCDFAQTFESHCHMAWATGQKEGVKYVVENKYDKLVVNIDDANVGRIIQQIIVNAVEHTDHGMVRALYEYMGGKLIIAINDTGSGISPDMLEHIFERFNTSSDRMQGTGLGLPICKELVTQLGGTIDINSEQGKGTAVWITLPCEASVIEHKKGI